MKLIPFLMQFKKHLILIGVIIAATIFYFLNKQPTQPIDDPLQPISTNSLTTNDAATTAVQKNDVTPETSIAVDIKGAVKKPGVYELEATDRVYDAIMAAGGYKQNANRQVINHAAHIQDEMVIYVPKKGEQLDPAIQSAAMTSQSNVSTNSTSTNEAVVNINTADETQLQTINGIGPAKAKAIVQYRLDNGPFQTVDDLTKVSGIGEKTLERLRTSVTVQ